MLQAAPLDIPQAHYVSCPVSLRMLWKCPLSIYWGFLTRMVYLYYRSCLRYTILVRNPQYMFLFSQNGLSKVAKGPLGAVTETSNSLALWGKCVCCWSGLQQSFQPPYHFIVLPRAFHSIFFHLIVFFIEKNVFALALKLKIAYSNTRTQAHSQAVVLLVVVLHVRRILLSSNTSSKANYGLCAETGKTAAALTNFSGFTKSTQLLTAVIFGWFAAVFFF